MYDGMVQTIQEVRHVEDMKKNLLSKGQFDDLGCEIEIQNKIMKVIQNALVCMNEVKIAANLYMLK